MSRFFGITLDTLATYVLLSGQAKAKSGWEARAHGLSDADILRMDEQPSIWSQLANRAKEGSSPMKDTERKTAAQLRSMIEEAQSLLQKMENFPEEPEQNLAVIEVQFNGYGRVYTYAALRVDRKWYVTGVSGLSKVDWFEVMEFFDMKNAGILKVEPAVRISDVRDFI